VHKLTHSTTVLVLMHHGQIGKLTHTMPCNDRVMCDEWLHLLVCTHTNESCSHCETSHIY